MSGRTEVDPVEPLCRALDGGDVGPLAARLDDKSLLRIPGHSGLSGDYQGREAIVGVVRRMAAASEGTLLFDVRDRTAQRGSVHIEGLLHSTQDGRPTRAMVSMLATLDGDAYRNITIECPDRSAWDAMWS